MDCLNPIAVHFPTGGMRVVLVAFCEMFYEFIKIIKMLNVY